MDVIKLNGGQPANFLDVGGGSDAERVKEAFKLILTAEHLEAIASMLHRGAIDPAVLRRNVVIRGINLLALKDKRFRVGQAVLEFTGLCHPCSRMEAALGPGGYNSLRGHGGITASVLEGGPIHIGDAVAVA